MSLALWVFDTYEQVERTEKIIGRAAAEHALVLSDAIALSWPADRPRPAKRRVYSVALSAALDDIGWGLVVGLLLQSPDPAASDGEPRAALTGTGIDEHGLARLRDSVRPGTFSVVVIGSADAVAVLESAAV